MATTRPDKNTVLKRTEKKNERLEIRSTSSQKSIIEKAASLMGESTTSFLLSSALRDALQVIQDHQVTELSLNDWNRFSEILESDSAPTSELKIAKRLHKKHVVNSDGV